MKRHIVVLLCVLCVVALPLVSSAHSGRTDSNGGHYNRSTGEYHYHHGYSAHQHLDGLCPYDSGATMTTPVPSSTGGAYSRYKEYKERQASTPAPTNTPKTNIFDKLQQSNTAKASTPTPDNNVSRGIVRLDYSTPRETLSAQPAFTSFEKAYSYQSDEAFYVLTIAERNNIISLIVILSCALLIAVCMWCYKNKQIKKLTYKSDKEQHDLRKETEKLKDELKAQKTNSDKRVQEARASGRAEAEAEAKKLLEADVRYRVRKEKQAFFSSLYEGKNMRDLVKVPRNTIIGDDGLPCNPNSEHWGPDYTVYITNNGQCYHKKSCHSLITSRAKPIHIYNAPELRDPCSICCSKSKEMNFEWFESYKSIMSIVKEYGIKIENSRLLSRRKAAITSLSNSQLKFSMRDPETNPTPTTPAQE